MSNKRILILGGSDFQIPLIKAAKNEGLFVITCDYLPDNPGHKLADQYINVSTTDKEAVLQVAINNKIDAITTFSSDPAIPTVAFVAQALGLPGLTLNMAEAFSNKDLFREILTKAGLNVPDFFITHTAAVLEQLDATKKYIVKPVDSSGSKGVRLSDGTDTSMVACIDYALSFSRSKKCIIEEYIDGPQIHGDAFYKEGRLIEFYYGDHYFYTATNSFIPISTRWPTRVSEELLEQLKNQLEKLSHYTGYLNGAINVEARVSSDNQIYIIEVGARNGGNFVPLIQKKLTGFDYVDAALRLSLGEPVIEHSISEKGIGAHYIIHAEKAGIFKSVEIDPQAKPYLFHSKLFKTAGDIVEEYCGSHTTIGVLLFEFPSRAVRDNIMDNIKSLVTVVCE